tara:strand:+ start:50 stop:703 length:654 start_codon:yes stop_codon:yes gene_type:complete
MKNIKYFKLLLLLLIAGSSFGQTNAPTESITASARIVAPITLSVDDGNLDFGTLIMKVAGTAGDVVMNPNALTITGTTNILPDKITGELSSFPTFTVTGELGLKYNITIPKVDVAIYLKVDGVALDPTDSGVDITTTNRMYIKDFTYSINNTTNVTGTNSATTDQTIGTTEAADSDAADTNSNANNNKFVVGGTLTVNANQIKGSYTGTYDVTVEYK